MKTVQKEGTTGQYFEEPLQSTHCNLKILSIS